MNAIQFWEGSGPQVRERLIAGGVLTPGSDEPGDAAEPRRANVLRMDAAGRRAVTVDAYSHGREQQWSASLWWRTRGCPEPHQWLCPDFEWWMLGTGGSL